MDFSEISIGQKCRCDYGDGQYFAFVRQKKNGRVGVQLTDREGRDSDPGDPIDRLGTKGLVWVSPESIHPM
jgi:hypothetical protein